MSMNALSREEFTELTAAMRPRLRRELRFVPEETSDWESRDFLAVTNKQGSEGVLIVPFLKNTVVPFSLQPRKPNTSGRIEAIICDICATWQRGTHSAVITFAVDKAHSASFLCCADLLCSLHVRGKTADATLSRTQVREQITPEARIQRLHDRLAGILSVYE
jgi:hypothetical protein